MNIKGNLDHYLGSKSPLTAHKWSPDHNLVILIFKVENPAVTARDFQQWHSLPFMYSTLCVWHLNPCTTRREENGWQCIRERMVRKVVQIFVTIAAKWTTGEEEKVHVQLAVALTGWAWLKIHHTTISTFKWPSVLTLCSFQLHLFFHIVNRCLLFLF